jgi:hypothetical protein
LATVKANSMSSISCGVGWRFVTIFRSEALIRLRRRATGPGSRRRRAEDLAGRQRVGQAAGDQQAQVLLGREDGLGLVVGPGAMTTSVKISVMAAAASAPVRRG